LYFLYDQECWLLPIYTSSFEKILLHSFVHFCTGPLNFLEFRFKLPVSRFCLLIPCQIHCWSRFSPTLWSASSVWWLFHLLCRSFVVSCTLISEFFLLIAELLEFHLGRDCLCLQIPVYSLFFLQKLQSLGPYFKVLDQLWIDICTGSKESIASVLEADIHFSEQHLLNSFFFSIMYFGKFC
jgi:hypothetical protein